MTAEHSAYEALARERRGSDEYSEDTLRPAARS